MTDHALLLSTPLIPPAMRGEKDITRRIPGPTNSFVDGKRVSGKKWKALDFLWDYKYVTIAPAGMVVYSQALEKSFFIEPIYKPGDTIWFRETWALTTNIENIENWPGRPNIPGETIDGKLYNAYIYAADGYFQWLDDDGLQTGKSYWRPSIHMPKAGARLWAGCISCRCEHIQDITEEQARREGCQQKIILYSPHPLKPVSKPKFFRHEVDCTYLEYFKELWGELHGPDSWPANPPVYVIEFKLLSTTGKPV